jgi:hypothetical protein
MQAMAPVSAESTWVQTNPELTCQVQAPSARTSDEVDLVDGAYEPHAPHEVLAQAAKGGP